MSQRLIYWIYISVGAAVDMQERVMSWVRRRLGIPPKPDDGKGPSARDRKWPEW